MSQKITSKNLSYDTSLPPFLAALKAQAAGSSGPDPLLAANRRLGKKRSGSEEAEDVPLVVDEHGNVVSVEVDKDGEVKQQPQDEASESAQDEKNKKDGEGKSEGDAKASIGGRKRKVGRVIGDAADEPDTKAAQPAKAAQKDEEPLKDRKQKKKAKKIKLSFDEDAG